jgi:hypothetical protein
MHPIKFIENRFQELRMKEHEEEKRNEYSIARDSEVLALQGLLKFFRVTLKWLMLPKVVLDYMLVVGGLKKRPRPVMIEKMKADIEAQAIAKKMAEEAAGNVKTLPQASVQPCESPA